MDDAEPRPTLRVRQTDGTIIEHVVDEPNISISDLKLSLSQRLGIPKERIRLMFESTILEDTQTIEHYGIDNNSTIQLVQLARATLGHPSNGSGISNTNSRSPAPPALSIPNQTRQLLLSNPQLAQAFMMANPMMREAMEANPELRQMMSDPEVMQQSLNAAQNPRLMQEVQRNNDRALSNLESVPGGYAHIRRMYHTYQEPLARAAEGSMRSSLDELNRRRARVLGVTKPDSSKVNVTPLPNPWAKKQTQPGGHSGFDARNPLAMMDQVSHNTNRLARLNISTANQPSTTAAQQDRMTSTDELLALLSRGSGSGSQPSLVSRMRSAQRSRESPAAGDTASSPRQMSAMSMVNPAYSGNSHLSPSPAIGHSDPLSESNRMSFQERHRDSLELLEEMGFPDQEKNLHALIEADGDLDEALTIITYKNDR
ncbi:hypothetical protein COEREDRAFT_81305 [Coemansia reversa NRRL 1564]|uniref:Uncharacterized protein n=1 Tax=Coemansia reversa (strain ATCC 12441 / NRRL 1564) TaxID=763665 RepID=A0A2G5BBD8_COERN|nr:hypothetical protein COEREDRAFT_81305 [Coemansia reversa NRRL 1564]|eukprot:PIA16329.1 hypothetical protein COEREDRAFT_81305 [Coemansia reversa NRRL 1564]